MSSSQETDLDEQPEIVHSIKGSVFAPSRDHWYCCKEKDTFHGIAGRETFGRSTGKFCNFCDHARCLKCNSRDKFLTFWRCCKTSMCHNTGTRDIKLRASSFRSQYWVVNEMDYGCCRLCGHPRCDDCYHERYPDRSWEISNIESTNSKSLFESETSVESRDATAVERDEWSRILTWSKAMRYQKIKLRGGSVNEDKIPDKVKKIKPSVIELPTPNETHVARKEEDTTTQKDENTLLKGWKEECIAAFIATSPGPSPHSEK
ncbi:uncharacterized protein RSE6_06943 [Rhynchosporium secalis]|uniref:Uncharacterized protein n=1 Tax=Rhynchosporium secalis TaxID=38038 RepID=A0A1E1MBP4_RHYSE|nr:uncharacterized protein RSE6_06943 [Rhynchosporium secalis]